MPDQLVRLQLGSIFHNFKSRIHDLRDEVVVEGGKILRREEEASIRLRFYDTGKTLNSLQEEIVRDGERITYRLFPTAVSEKGAPYPLFGEYGTGRRGAASGKPAPKGYRYGDRLGMRARRYSRIAVVVAKPLIEARAKQLVSNFTVN